MTKLLSCILFGIVLSSGIGATEVPVYQGTFQSKSGVETRFEFLAGEREVILKVHCDEPAMNNLRAAAKVHDVDVWKDDYLEIFINPLRSEQNYAQFAVSPTGAFYDARLVNNNRDPQWDPTGIQIIPAKGKDFWSITMKIPAPILLSLLPDPKKAGPDQWSFNIVRTRKAGPRGEVTTFSPCANWLDTTKYTVIKNMPLDYKAMRWAADSLALKSIKRNGKTFRANVESVVDNRSDKMRFVKVSAFLRPLRQEKVYDLCKESVAIDKNQMFRLKKQVPLPGLGKYTLGVVVSDKKGMLHYAEQAVNVDFTPMRLAIVSGAYRGKDIFDGMKCKEIALKLHTDETFTLNDQTSCTLRLVNASGKTVAEKQYRGKNLFTRKLSFPLPALADGKYICKATFNNKAIPSAETTLIKHPAALVETWVNEKGNLVRNGKEVFVIGSFGSWKSFVEEKDRDLGDFVISFGPLGKKSAVNKAKADSNMGFAAYPETRALWSHHAARGGAQRALRPIPETTAKIFADHIGAYRGSDLVFGYYLCDEPAESRNLPLYLKQLNDICNTADPYHPTLITFNNGPAASVYGESCDIAIVDYFPGFHIKGKEKSLTTIIPLLNDVAKRIGNKPVIAAPPLYAYADTGQFPARYPTYQEMRCMSFSALTCDAVRGLSWNDGVRVGYSVELYFGVPAIAREIKLLETFWLSRDAVKLKVGGKDAKKLQWIARKVNGKLYVLMVNPTDDPLSVTVQLPAGTKELAAEKNAVPTSTLNFKPLQVRIFSNDPAAPALENAEAVENRIKTFQKADDGNLCHNSKGTKVFYSPSYGTGHRTFALKDHQAWLTDHLYSYTYRCAPVKADRTPYLGIEFKQEEKVGTFEIAWNIYGTKVSDAEFQFVLEKAESDSTWKEIPIEKKEIQRFGKIVKIQCRIKPDNIRKFRVRFLNRKPAVISPCEIKAFAKQSNTRNNSNDD